MMIELIHASFAGPTMIAIDMHPLLTKFAHNQQIQILLLLIEILLIQPWIGRIPNHQYEVVDCYHSKKYIIKRQQYRQDSMIDLSNCADYKGMEHDEYDY